MCGRRSAVSRLAVLTLALAAVAPGGMFSSRGAEPRKVDPAPSALADHPARSARWVVRTPDVEFSPSGSTEIDDVGSFSSLRMPGFAPADRTAGEPDLPRKIYRVAIPFGAEVSLQYKVLRRSMLDGVVPRPAPRWVYEDGIAEAVERSPETPRRRALYRGDREVYQGRHPFPSEPVRLGRRGVLRNQQFVEVIVEPLCFLPDRQSVEKLDEIEISVSFAGGEAVRSVPSAPERFFESVYRDSFVNGDQAKFFRRSRTRGAEEALAASRAPEGQTEIRIRVTQDGVRRIDFATLAGYGLGGVPVSMLRLTGRGVSIPLIEDGNGDDQLSPGEFLLFYGERLDDEPRSILNYDVPGSPLDIYAAADFSDENVYFLDAPGVAQAGPQTLDGTPTFARVPPTDFEENLRAEVDDGYRPLGGADPWYWLPTMSLNFNSPDRLDSIQLAGLADGALPATFEVKVRGVSDDIDTAPDHGLRFTVRNDQAQVVGSETIEFEGRNVASLTLDTNGAAPLTEGIQTQTEVLTGLWNRNDVILDYIDVTYRRSFVAEGGRLLFRWPDEDAEFVIDGVPSAGARVYELTAGVVSTLRPIVGASIVGPGPVSVRFRVDDDPALPPGSIRRFLVVDESAIATVPLANTEIRNPSDLRNTAQQADMIVIGHPDVLDLGPGRPADLWLQHRQSLAGGGLSVKVAMMQEVADEFGFGLAGPESIRSFLSWVMSDEAGEGWADPKPAFVLLVGDASFDYKGGTGAGVYVPTQMMFYDQVELGYHASDSDLASVVGDDGIPDLIVGRIPARTQTQADLVFQKTVDYETSASAGNWNSSVLMISDRGKFLADGITPNPNETAEFEIVNDSAAAHLGEEPYNVRHLRYLSQYYDLFSNPWNLMRADIKAAVNGTDGLANGRAIVQFIGHGNFQVWSDDAFWDERPPISLQDSRDLSNSNRLSLVLAQNCLTGGFHACPSGDCGFETYNLAEQWLFSPGGAVATFAPTGLSFTYVGREASDRLWSSLFGPTQERHLAPALLSAYVGLCAENRRACQYYSLLGDPALRLQLPTVDPPGSLQAVAANMSVDLSWDPSGTPSATYDVYRRRADFAFFDYVKANSAPIVGTVFTDVGLTNALPYEYYVVARDPQGFRSSQSNFNADCPGGGDCVRATPLNPNPPFTPTPVGLDDPGIGDSLRFEWLPNQEVDLQGYTVHWGDAPGNLTQTQAVGPTGDSLLVRGLSPQTTYFFSVSATNTSGLTSSLSVPVSDFPVLAPGDRPPSFISDLSLSKSGNDLVLNWSEVTEDSYGKPLQPVLYQILRGSGTDFTNASASVLGTCAAPCTSWVHVNAAISALSFHYRIRAVDAAGLVGSLGAPYPDGTSLRIENSVVTPGDRRLSWDAVTQNLEGGVVPGPSYEVYRSSAPIRRDEISSGVLLPFAVVTTTSMEVTPSAASEYYSVFAVDSRGNRSPY